MSKKVGDLLNLKKLQVNSNKKTEEIKAFDNTDAIKPNRTFKDATFRYIFKEKDKFVELYKSLSGIELNPNEVESFDLDSLVISDWHNDVSFVTKDRHIIILLEQQSSYCANMSVRCLVYYSNLIRKLYENDMDKFKNRIYSKNKLFLPRPEFFVLYMGKEELSEEYEMLSSHFIDSRNASIDLRVLNIDIKYNNDFMQNTNTSDTLHDYSFFVHRYQYHYDSAKLSHLSKINRSREALNLAKQDCISQGFFVDYLNREEFYDMAKDEFTMDNFIALKEQEAREEGKQEGIQALVLDYLEEGFSKEKIILKLQKRFSLTRTQAEHYYNRFNKN